MQGPEIRLGGLMARAAKAFSKRMIERFREAGEEVSIEQWMILVRLWNEQGLPQHEIGAAFQLDKTIVTRAITSLEQQNIVVRVPDQQDKRINRIYLTHLGKQLRERLMALVDEVHAQALRDISQEEIDCIKNLMRRMLQNLQSDSAECL